MTVWTAGVALFTGVAALAALAALITGEWGTFAKALFIMIVAVAIRFGGLGIQAIGLRASQRSARALQDWLRVRLDANGPDIADGATDALGQ
ncbi:MAG: hypothetical protein ACLP01_28535 [Solirubrobacteraceae bacterium]